MFYTTFLFIVLTKMLNKLQCELNFLADGVGGRQLRKCQLVLKHVVEITDTTATSLY